jgi:hypothetical protein
MSEPGEETEAALQEEQLIEQLCVTHSQALDENPSLVRFLAMIFLKFRKNDVASASERLERYLEWRRELLGDLSDQTIENNEHLKRQVETLFFTVLPNSLPGGEAILYMELRRHNTSVFTAEDTVKTWHYLVMRALRKDPSLAARGFYVTGNLTNVSYYNIDIKIPHAISDAVSKCMPVRVCQFLIINPPYVAHMILPVIRMLLSSKLSQRLNIVTDYSHLQDHYQIPAAGLPEAIGGAITETMFQNIVSTIVAENIII